MEPMVDLIAANASQGEVAAYMASNGKMDPAKMRPFIAYDGKSYVSVYKGQGDPKDVANYMNIQVNTGTLRRDEWKQLDEAIQPIAESRLVGIQDLISKGLVYNLGNAMGTTVLETHDVSDALDADLTMDGITRGKNDRPVYGTHYLPIPILHADYEINARALAASRSLGNPLDTTMAERAARKVAEKLESMLFTDTTYTFGGGTIYSYVKYPDRNEVELTTGWDESAATGAAIISDVRKMKQALIDAHFYGPYVLYIPTAYETKMDEDYSSAKGENTVRDRILKIAGISDVKVVDTLATDNVILVQMTSDVVRLVRGMGITNVQWQTEGNFINKYKVLTIQVPQIRSDQNRHCGIAHLA